MSQLSPVEAIRLQNLAELHGRPSGFGAPTSKHLVNYLNSRDVPITSNELTSIYQGEQALSEQRAAAIEGAFDLPLGWLSTDHQFIFELTPSELATHAKLSSLSPELKQRFYALVDALPRVNSNGA